MQGCYKSITFVFLWHLEDPQIDCSSETGRDRVNSALLWSPNLSEGHCFIRVDLNIACEREELMRRTFQLCKYLASCSCIHPCLGLRYFTLESRLFCKDTASNFG